MRKPVVAVSCLVIFVIAVLLAFGGKPTDAAPVIVASEILPPGASTIGGPGLVSLPNETPWNFVYVYRNRGYSDICLTVTALEGECSILLEGTLYNNPDDPHLPSWSNTETYFVRSPYDTVTVCSMERDQVTLEPSTEAAPCVAVWRVDEMQGVRQLTGQIPSP